MNMSDGEEVGDGEGFEADMDWSFGAIGRTMATEVSSMTENGKRGEAERSLGDNTTSQNEAEIQVSPDQKMKMILSG
jgi:hypothetical protein